MQTFQHDSSAWSNCSLADTLIHYTLCRPPASLMASHTSKGSSSCSFSLLPWARAKLSSHSPPVLPPQVILVGLILGTEASEECFFLPALCQANIHSKNLRTLEIFMTFLSPDSALSGKLSLLQSKALPFLFLFFFCYVYHLFLTFLSRNKM